MSDDGTTGPPNATRDRPTTEESYGIPTDDGSVLDWAFVEERFRTARNVWVTTTRPDGRPHARPTWCVWVDGTVHCGGGEGTRWMRNLDAASGITVHGESAESVAIVEGTAEKLTAETADRDRLDRLDDAYLEKYDVRHGTPFVAVRPTAVFAWRDYPHDATRWRFETE